jgi:aryl-alcohol dehydrogenase-like predicted oxidoreductase
MNYRALGKTGMNVSELGFGASSLGGVFHSFNENRGIDAVFAAVDAGINIIDVSPYYGHYKAETVLGKALKDIPRDKFFLSTKVGRYGKDGVNTWDYSARRAKESVYESLERLHIDYIDIINVHDIEFQGRMEGGLQKVVDETLPALHELKKEGVVRHVGITDLQLENLKWVIEHCPEGTVESVMNFCHYCLCDDKLIDFMDFFEEHGIGVLSASPFSMGLLTTRGVPDWHPAPKPLVEVCRKAAAYCQEKGYPIEKLAMQFACSNSRIASTVFSTTRPEAITTNLAYIEEPMDEQLVQEVRAIIGDQQRVSWANT